MSKLGKHIVHPMEGIRWLSEDVNYHLALVHPVGARLQNNRDGSAALPKISTANRARHTGTRKLAA